MSIPPGPEGERPEQGPPYGQQPYGQAGYGYGPPAPRNGTGTAALVTGVIGLVMALAGFLLITLLVGIGLGIAAIVTGVIGRRRAARGEATNSGVAVAGIVLGVLAILACVAWLVFFGFALARASDCFTLPADEQQQCVIDTFRGTR